MKHEIEPYTFPTNDSRVGAFRSMPCFDLVHVPHAFIQHDGSRSLNICHTNSAPRLPRLPLGIHFEFFSRRTYIASYLSDATDFSEFTGWSVHALSRAVLAVSLRRQQLSMVAYPRMYHDWFTSASVQGHHLSDI